MVVNTGDIELISQKLSRGSRGGFRNGWYGGCAVWCARGLLGQFFQQIVENFQFHKITSFPSSV
uniref:Uncharacterized protein n=1 Tax=Siphoviridae sp. ctWBz6 TaxID=2825536 RepID=A0A8S5QEZ6_9CAUD|nr:MAG TPA: hypothetical protein [Siphoviridae sp. ctWBz6]